MVKYKVREYMQHLATRDIFRVIKRRGIINVHYTLKLIHSKYKYELGRNTDWLSEENLTEFYRPINKDQVALFYVK